MYRILRSIKNRFGSTAELGIYEMRQDGLRQVSNPSELLLTQDHEGMSGIAIACAVEGIRPFLIEVQALVSTAAYGMPQRSATGFDLRRMNMLLAVLEKRVGFETGAEGCLSEHRRRTEGERSGHRLGGNQCHSVEQHGYGNRSGRMHGR